MTTTDSTLATAAEAYWRSRTFSGQTTAVTAAASATDALAGFWTRLAAAAAEPDWQPLADLDHGSTPVHVMRGHIAGHPGVEILAAAMPLAGGWSLALAAARPCREAGHYEVTTLAHVNHLATVLHHDAVHAHADHAHCAPPHTAREAFQLREADLAELHA